MQLLFRPVPVGLLFELTPVLRCVSFEAFRSTAGRVEQAVTSQRRAEEIKIGVLGRSLLLLEVFFLRS